VSVAPYVRLEPLTQRHHDAVAAIVGDPEIRRFTRFPEPPHPEFPREWIARYESGLLDGTRVAFAALGADGHFLGTGLAPDIDAEAREMELGYLVAPDARGRGVGSEILRRLTGWAFDEGRALRVQLLIDVENVASQRVAERAGYLLEGTMRSVHHKNDVRIDCQIWSRLSTDTDQDA
jgi:RimJ/RimL family protein N-acetyltransferase